MRKNRVPPRQHVECETCREVFLDMDAWEYVKVSRCYANRGKQPSIDWQDVADGVTLMDYSKVLGKAKAIVEEGKGFYDKFFCKAVLHWCDNPEHTIVVSVPLGNNGPMQRFDLTADLKGSRLLFGDQFVVATKRLMELLYDDAATI
jgi:hypothetical protein